MGDSLHEIMALSEASKIWGLANSTLRTAIFEGRFTDKDVRKSGGVWLIKKSSMIRAYGEPKPKTKKNSK